RREQHGDDRQQWQLHHQRLEQQHLHADAVFVRLHFLGHFGASNDQRFKPNGWNIYGDGNTEHLQHHRFGHAERHWVEWGHDKLRREQHGDDRQQWQLHHQRLEQQHLYADADFGWLHFLAHLGTSNDQRFKPDGWSI